MVSSGRKQLSPPFIFLPSHPTKHTLKKISFTFSFQSFLSTLFHFQTNTPKWFKFQCNKWLAPQMVSHSSFCTKWFQFQCNKLLTPQMVSNTGFYTKWFQMVSNIGFCTKWFQFQSNKARGTMKFYYKFTTY